MTISEKIKVLCEIMPQFKCFAEKELTVQQNKEIEAIYNFYNTEVFLQQEISQRKKEQRVFFRKKRDALPSELLDKYAQQATEKVLNLSEYKKSKLVFVPISFGREQIGRAHV